MRCLLLLWLAICLFGIKGLRAQGKIAKPRKKRIGQNYKLSLIKYPKCTRKIQLKERKRTMLLTQNLKQKLQASLCITTLLFLSAACSSLGSPLQVSAPANLTRKCSKLGEFTGSTVGAFLKYSTIMAQKYNECSARHAALVKFVDKK